ncbi:hypothetical protein LO763_10010 [Glycomyces sp. A-F 0318]|uniref:hypothetical protein n=1 Tax=Glycomyces amatae TaxID=2881355 RepID=UPI001E3BF05C|nr:hypothetical protein [Glycomyces amatae]MCD0443957.1 hypothetical protein [Glycomyces amatae]
MTDFPNARQRLAELARRTTAPAAVRRAAPALEDIDSPEFDVASGQIWVGRQEEASALLVVLGVGADSRTAMAAPLTVEPGVEAVETVVLTPDSSPLGLATVVWTGLAQSVPVRVLDQPLGRLPEPIADLLAQTPQQMPKIHSGLGVRPGEPDHDPRSPNAMVKAELEDLFEQWASSLEPIGPGPAEPAERVDSRLPVRLADVMAILGIAQPGAMEIVRRERPLTSVQLKQLAEGTGIPEDGLQPSVPGLPRALLTELEQPRWRRLVEAESASAGVDESAARQRLGQDAYVLAARQKGSSSSVWRLRLRAIAHARLGDEPLGR